jgi:hypothetical protein
MKVTIKGWLLPEGHPGVEAATEVDLEIEFDPREASEAIVKAIESLACSVDSLDKR